MNGWHMCIVGGYVSFLRILAIRGIFNTPSRFEFKNATKLQQSSEPFASLSTTSNMCFARSIIIMTYSINSDNVMKIHAETIEISLN